MCKVVNKQLLWAREIPPVTIDILQSLPEAWHEFLKDGFEVYNAFALLDSENFGPPRIIFLSPISFGISRMPFPSMTIILDLGVTLVVKLRLRCCCVTSLHADSSGIYHAILY